ncbi:MAG: Hsp70 family protein [Planctomycetaceae bacterium]
MDHSAESTANSETSTHLVGIDLGTTNSLVAVFLAGQPRLIPNVHGSFLTPSVVGVLDDGQVIVGDAARELRVTKPERCASTFKRLMGTDEKLRLGSHQFTAPELSSLVLKSLKEDAEAFLKSEVTEAVITVPAYFNDNQRKATKMAGELAGLKVRRIINEPTAAALTYGFHDRGSDKKLIVIDLGGGTFDVTLMEIFEGTLEIKATAGESFLGGEDFTERLVAWVLNQSGEELELAELKRPLKVSRLRQECEVAKRALLKEPEAIIRVPGDNGEYSANPTKLTMTRPMFAKLAERLMDRLRKPIDKALRDGECDPDGIEEVILVGGATRMPVLVDFVRNYFQREPLCRFNPDEVVALGAAVQSALMTDNSAVDDMVMTDVCPFTLGVAISKEFGNQILDGYFMPIIPRNTTIPVSREEVVATMFPNQREVVVRVFQGEARKVEGNLLLGELRVTDIPAGPKGTPICIRFTYDLNGILEVEAFPQAGGKRFRAVLTQHVKGLSTADIQAAVRNLSKLKFYPRDDVRNQKLLRFCERIAGEVSSFQRTELDEIIDSFESAMSSGDRDYFEVVRNNLLMVLSALGFEYPENHESNENHEP